MTFKIILFLFTLSICSADTIGVIFPLKSKNFYEFYRLIKDEIKDKGDTIKIIDSDQGNRKDIVQGLIDDKVNYVICLGSVPTQIGRESGLPGIFLFISNPLKLGLIDENFNPLTNLTGIDLNSSPVLMMDILRKIFPSISLGIVYNPLESKYYITKLKEVSSGGGTKIIERSITDSSETLSSYTEMKGKINLILTFFDLTIFNAKTGEFLLKFSMMNRIPLIGTNEMFTKNGALISFSFDFEALVKQVAVTIGKLKTGTLPKDIKIEFPDKVIYSINLNTAKMLNIVIPDEIVKAAKKVYDSAS
jgi:putative tryptophan/tyrosine transport system substrate-binding protein